MHDFSVVRCILSADSGWQVRNADVKEKGCRDECLWDIVEAPQPALFAGGKGEDALPRPFI